LTSQENYFELHIAIVKGLALKLDLAGIDLLLLQGGWATFYKEIQSVAFCNRAYGKRNERENI